MSCACRELVSTRWGFVPVSWKKLLEDVPATVDARARTVAEKSMLRDAVKKWLCIVPASGLFEWTGGRVPHLFTAGEGSPILAFAGPWDRWTDLASGDEVLSATIIVSGASAWMTPQHNRMPVLLAPESFDGSLGPEALQPAAESALREWIVSSRVIRTGHGDDDPTIIEPVAEVG